MKKILVILILLLMPLVAMAANEDFTTYDETDEGTNVTVISSKVSWVALQRAHTSHVSDSKGVGHFSGDFTHQFEVQFSNVVLYPILYHWAIANTQADSKTIIDASGDFQGFQFQNNAVNDLFVLVVCENGSLTVDSWVSPTASTTYYVTLTRDDDGGANNTGQLVAVIRITSHAGAIQDTLTVDCSAGEQNDFQYVFGVMSYDSGHAGSYVDGFTQNLDLGSSFHSKMINHGKVAGKLSKRGGK